MLDQYQAMYFCGLNNCFTGVLLVDNNNRNYVRIDLSIMQYTTDQATLWVYASLGYCPIISSEHVPKVVD